MVSSFTFSGQYTPGAENCVVTSRERYIFRRIFLEIFLSPSLSSYLIYLHSAKYLTIPEHLRHLLYFYTIIFVQFMYYKLYLTQRYIHLSYIQIAVSLYLVYQRASQHVLYRSSYIAVLCSNLPFRDCTCQVLNNEQVCCSKYTIFEEYTCFT